MKRESNPNFLAMQFTGALGNVVATRLGLCVNAQAVLDTPIRCWTHPRECQTPNPKNETYAGPLWEGYHEGRRCSRDTYLESYITKFTRIRS